MLQLPEAWQLNLQAEWGERPALWCLPLQHVCWRSPGLWDGAFVTIAMLFHDDNKTENVLQTGPWPSDIHDITGGLYCCGLRSESPGWTSLPQGVIMKNFFSFSWCKHAKKGARAEDWEAVPLQQKDQKQWEEISCQFSFDLNPPMQGLTGAQSRLYVWRSALQFFAWVLFILPYPFFFSALCSH